MRVVRSGVGVLAVMLVSCARGLGNAPIVLTEVPNQPSGEKLIAMGAERSGCRVAQEARGMRLMCAEGTLDVPTFKGPPTFAVRCTDKRLDVPHCTALVRKVLLATEVSGGTH